MLYLTEAMRKIKSVLVPVDFSDSSRTALDRAAALAEKLGAQVHLLHVWELPEALPREELESASGAHLASVLEKLAHDGLAAFTAEARARNIPIQSASVEGGVTWRSIVRAAETAPHDLVVMGTHGRKGFARALLGSVTERVVRYAPCPVLSVSGVAGVRQTGIQRILVPVDYSQGSARALSQATELAQSLEAQLDVVHVWDRPNFVPTETMVELRQERRSLGELIRENAELEMREFLQTHSADPAAGVPPHRLLSGEPAAALVGELERGEHDLVVVGTHGRTGLKHLLLGSVAEKLVRYSPVPVLTVR
jgi:nucleotide-binding universal stress UspA family protein